MKARLLLLLMSFSFCFSCTSSPRAARLWTNREEFAAYVEAFNVSQDKVRLEIQYRERPGEALAESVEHPDIVIASYLNNKEGFSHFRPLDTLEIVKQDNRSAIYPELLKRGQFEDRQYLLPLSFNLPALMFLLNQANEEVPDFALDLETIKKRSEAFNKETDSRFSAMGFSPRWDPEFLYILCRLFDADIREGKQFYLLWDEKRLKDALEYCKEWIVSANGGIEAEENFENRYLHEPDYMLLKKERILFAFTDAAGYYRLPENYRFDLDYRWISYQNRIQTTDDILFAGIPEAAKNPKGGEQFLNWLMKEEVQEQLIEDIREKQILSFGFADGFSSLQVVNEVILPQIYPGLLGKIPPPSRLKFPPQLPEAWPDIKASVLYPWLRNNLNADQRAEDLGREIESWLMKNGRS